MKTLAILATFSVLFALGVFIYGKMETKRFEKKELKANYITPATTVKEKEDTIKTPNRQDTGTNTVEDPIVPNNAEIIINEKKNKKPSPHFSDWQDNDISDLGQQAENRDPWTVLIHKQNAKDRGAYIEDPENMDIDELIEAERQQLIERFGDIPAVHTYTSLKPKVLSKNIHPDEEITFLKAQYALFPAESTRKSIILAEWNKSRSGSTSTINQADIEYLKSEGITVTKNGTRITITTE